MLCVVRCLLLVVCCVLVGCFCCCGLSVVFCFCVLSLLSVSLFVARCLGIVG